MQEVMLFAGCMSEYLKTLSCAAQPGHAARRVSRTFCVQDRARAGGRSEAMLQPFQSTEGVAVGYLVPGVGGQKGHNLLFSWTPFVTLKSNWIFLKGSLKPINDWQLGLR